MNRIFVSGLLNVETTVAVRGFPINYYPIDYPFFGVNSNVAGVGCNAAKALTALGDEVRLVSYTGKDAESERIFKDLEEHGIASDMIKKELKKTPASVILFDPDGRRQVYCDLKDIQEQSVEPGDMKDELDAAAITVLCNINFNRSLIKYAHDRGCVTATDVHVLSDTDDGYNKDFMENARILFLSDERLPCSPEEFALRLYEKYRSSVIVIGMGAKGAMLLDESIGKPVMIPAYSPEKIVNTVGAGDALFSAFIHFYAKGMSAEDSLRRAVIFAGIKIGFNGASIGFTTEENVEHILKKQTG